MNKNKTTNLALSAMLCSITVIIAFIPIRTLGAEITLTMVPIAIGAICLGEYTGLLLGTVFGLTSFFQCFGYSAFGAALFSVSPVMAFIMCVPTRMLAGYLTGLISRATRKRLGKFSYALCSLLCPLFNTLFFMSALVICFYNTDYIQSFVKTLHAANPLIFIVLFVGINGLIELLAGFILALPCSIAVGKFLTGKGGRYYH